MVTTQPADEAQRIEALRPLPDEADLDLGAARFAGGTVFTSKVTRPTHSATAGQPAWMVDVFAWAAPYTERRTLAQYTLAAAPEVSLEPSVDGAWLLVTLRCRPVSFGREAAMLFVVDAHATDPAVATASLVNLVDAPARWVGARQLAARARSATFAGENAPAWFVYDVTQRTFVDVVEGDVPPSQPSEPVDPNRAALAAAHLEPVALARTRLAGVDDAATERAAASLIDAREAGALLFSRACYGAVTDEACDACERAIQLAPTWADPHAALAAKVHQRGEIERLLGVAERWCAAFPEDADAHLQHAIALAQLGRHDDALVALDRTETCDPGAESTFATEDGLEPLYDHPGFARYL